MAGKRKTKFIILFIVLVAISAGIGTYFYYHGAAIVLKWKIRDFLESHDISPISLKISRFTATNLDIRSVRIGRNSEISIDDISVTYSPRSLSNFKVKSIMIDGLGIKIGTTDFSDEKSLFSKISSLAATDDGKKGNTVIPFDSVEISRSSIEYSHGGGTFLTDLSLKAASDDNLLKTRIDLNGKITRMIGIAPGVALSSLDMKGANIEASLVLDKNGTPDITGKLTLPLSYLKGTAAGKEFLFDKIGISSSILGMKKAVFKTDISEISYNNYEFSVGKIGCGGKVTIRKNMPVASGSFKLSGIETTRTESIPSDIKVSGKYGFSAKGVESSIKASSESLETTARLTFKTDDSFKKGILSVDTNRIDVTNIPGILPLIRGLTGIKLDFNSGYATVNGSVLFNEPDFITTFPEPDIAVTLSDFGFSYEKMMIDKLAWKARIKSISPPVVKSETPLTIEEGSVGTELSAITLAPSLLNKLAIIRDISIGLLDGKITSNVVRAGIAEQSVEPFKLRINGISIEKVMNLALKGKVSATGGLKGTIPILRSDKSYVIKGGLLENETTGIIKYDPHGSSPLAATGNQYVNILKNYLRDFHYEKISITLNSRKNYDLMIRLMLFGRNPGYFDGRPLKLNMNLKLNLYKLYLSRLGYTEIPKSLEQKLLKQFGE